LLIWNRWRCGEVELREPVCSLVCPVPELLSLPKKILPVSGRFDLTSEEGLQVWVLATMRSVRATEDAVEQS